MTETSLAIVRITIERDHLLHGEAYGEGHELFTVTVNWNDGDRPMVLHPLDDTGLSASLSGIQAFGSKLGIEVPEPVYI